MDAEYTHTYRIPERRTAQAFVEDELRRAILGGHLRPGSRILQNDLAKSMGVSTTPVREALRSLAAEGLVRLESHRGAVVHEINESDLLEIYQLRELLEPFAMRMAVRNITPDELEEAEALHEQMATESNPARWAELNRRFHALLVEASRSPRLNAILSRLRDTAAFYVAITLRDNEEFLKSAHEEHGQLLEACKRGDEEEAAQVTIQHLRATIHGAKEALQAMGGDRAAE